MYIISWFYFQYRKNPHYRMKHKLCTSFIPIGTHFHFIPDKIFTIKHKLTIDFEFQLQVHPTYFFLFIYFLFVELLDAYEILCLIGHIIKRGQQVAFYHILFPKRVHYFWSLLSLHFNMLNIWNYLVIRINGLPS